MPKLCCKACSHSYDARHGHPVPRNAATLRACHDEAATEAALVSEAVELSAALRAERMLPPCGQPSIYAWHHLPC